MSAKRLNPAAVGLPAYRPAMGQKWSDRGPERLDDLVAEEMPVALVYNEVSHAVMMTSPADFAEFAVGFSLSEGIIADACDLSDIRISATAQGTTIEMRLTPDRFERLGQRHRSLTGHSGCGLCGIDSLVEALRPLPRAGQTAPVSIESIRKALADLPRHQVLNRVTRALHGAAWADRDGTIHRVFEDVGRHNALDKLIGALALDRVDFTQGFAIVTSRLSFELVQKAATVGIPILIAISAPTALALRTADEAGLTVGAIARSDSVVIFTHRGRVTG